MADKKLAEIAALIRNKDKASIRSSGNDALIQALNKRMPKDAIAEQRLQRAIAEHQPRASWQLTVSKTVAGTDPLTLDIEMILLPLDKPNKNKQLVPVSEKDNILRSAKFKPIRAAFDGDT